MSARRFAFVRASLAPLRYKGDMQSNAKGTFAIQMTPEPPYSSEDGITLARAKFDKQFSGDLVGVSEVQFLGARTPVATSAGYVAIERFVGSVGERRGSFVLQHSGVMKGGQQSLTVSVVPDSGTGQLVGLTGTMSIDIVDKQHHYTFAYAVEGLADAPPPAG